MTLQFDEKYRPRTLDKIIGHEVQVQRLRGIIASGKYPHAMLFVGPTSAGKTTIARAFAADMFGVKVLKGDPDFHELNSADSRGIDDMRKMLQIARLQPRKAPRRVFLFDEAQGFTGDSSRLLLKPLEEPPKKTLFMLGSMEPEKLDRAMKNRCQQFILNAPSQADMTKFVKRIVKGEDMKYMTDDLVKVVVDNSNGEMRAAALIMEAITQTMHGQKKIKAEDILKVLDSVESSDDALAVEVLASVYKLKLGSVYRHLLDMQAGFAFINKLMNLNRFLISNFVLKGAKHKAVWWSKANQDMHKIVKEVFSSTGLDESKSLSVMTLVQMELVDLKREAGAFQVNESDAIAYRLARSIREIKPFFKKSKE